MVDVRMEDIPYELHTMADIIGMDNFVEVSKFYGGTAVYIPMYKKVILGKRNREILRAYNGRNIDELRLKYGMTNQQIKRIVSNNNILN